MTEQWPACSSSLCCATAAAWPVCGCAIYGCGMTSRECEYSSASMGQALQQSGCPIVFQQKAAWDATLYMLPRVYRYREDASHLGELTSKETLAARCVNDSCSCMVCTVMVHWVFVVGSGCLSLAAVRVVGVVGACPCVLACMVHALLCQWTAWS